MTEWASRFILWYLGLFSYPLLVWLYPNTRADADVWCTVMLWDPGRVYEYVDSRLMERKFWTDGEENYPPANGDRGYNVAKIQSIFLGTHTMTPAVGKIKYYTYM